MSYTKSITPICQAGQTGYVGELHAGDQLIHSMEYSTYSQAEQALDALAFDIMTDMQMDDAPEAEDDSGELTEAMADDDYADAMAEQAMGTYNGKVPSDFAPSTCCFCSKPHSPQSCPDMRALLLSPDATCVACGDLTGNIDRVCPACREWGSARALPLDVDFAPVGFEV